MDTGAIEALKAFRELLAKRRPSTLPDDFWFEGKLWSEMTDEEKDTFVEQFGR